MGNQLFQIIFEQVRSLEAAGSFAIRSAHGLLTNGLHIFERLYVAIRNGRDHLDGKFRVNRISFFCRALNLQGPVNSNGVPMCTLIK